MLPADTMPDATEWVKVSENIVKTRIWLYQVQQIDTIDPIYADKIGHIRYLLTVCLEEIDKLGAHDGKGWLC